MQKAASSCEELGSALRKLPQARGVGRAELPGQGKAALLQCQARREMIPSQPEGLPRSLLCPPVLKGNLYHTSRCRLPRKRILH